MGSFASPLTEQFNSYLRTNASGDCELAGSTAEESGDIEIRIDVIHAIVREADAGRLSAARVWLWFTGQSAEFPAFVAGRKDQYVCCEGVVVARTDGPMVTITLGGAHASGVQCRRWVLLELHPHGA